MESKISMIVVLIVKMLYFLGTIIGTIAFRVIFSPQFADVNFVFAHFKLEILDFSC